MGASFPHPVATAEQRARVVALYADGVKVVAIAEAVGLKVTTAHMIVVRAGACDRHGLGPDPSRRMTAEQLDRLVEGRRATMPDEGEAGRLKRMKCRKKAKRGYPQSPWGEHCPLLPLLMSGVARTVTPALMDADEWLRSAEGVALLSVARRAVGQGEPSPVKAVATGGGATIRLTWPGGERVFTGERTGKAGVARTPQQTVAAAFIEGGRKLKAMGRQRRASA